MKFFSVFILAFCCSSVLGVQIQRKNQVTDTVGRLLESVLGGLANLQIDYLDLVGLSLQNVTIQNLETFTVEKINALGLLTASVGLRLELVQITAWYFLDTELPLVGNVTGEGNVFIGLREVKISAELDFKPDIFKPVLKDIKLLEIKVDLANGLFDSIDGGNETNSAISAALPNLIEESAQLLQKHIPAIVEAINSELSLIS